MRDYEVTIRSLKEQPCRGLNPKRGLESKRRFRPRRMQRHALSGQPSLSMTSSGASSTTQRFNQPTSLIKTENSQCYPWLRTTTSGGSVNSQSLYAIKKKRKGLAKSIITGVANQKG